MEQDRRQRPYSQRRMAVMALLRPVQMRQMLQQHRLTEAVLDSAHRQRNQACVGRPLRQL